MPENAHSQSDLPLEAPSLMALSAEIVAINAEHLLVLNKSFGPNGASSTAQASSSKFTHSFSRVVGLRDQAAEQSLIQHQTAIKHPNKTDALGFLPEPAANLVLKKMCDKWRRRENAMSPEEIDNAVQPFYDGAQCPVTSIDLTKLQVTDRILAALLVNHRNTLSSLNLCSTKGINAVGVCSLLQKSKVRLGTLRSLKLNSTDLLRVPKCRRYHPYVPAMEMESVGLDRALNALINNTPTLLNNDDNTRLPTYGADRRGRRNRVWTENFANELLADGAEMDEEKLRAIVEYDEAQIHSPPQFVQFCSELEHLYLVQGLSYNIEDETRPAFLARILAELKHLRTLDLSEWLLTDFTVLQKLENLTSLILYDIHNLEGSIDTLCKFYKLTGLDLSQSDRSSSGLYAQPVTALHKLVSSLPKLKYLDISGTNLTTLPSENDRPFRGAGTIDSDIPGLSYLKKPLKYLGIFNCESSSQYKNIPAEKISGDHGEDQVLTAMEMYLERPKTMQAVLNESYHLYRFGTNLSRQVEALHLVLKSMSLHLNNSNLQIAGSASMFYIIRSVKMNWSTRRRVIFALIDGMENHLDEQVMVRNCCLCLCQFDIPQDIMFGYGHVANLLVKVLETHSSDPLTQRIVVFLLNSMACHVEGVQKIEVGEFGAIEIILQQIARKLQSNQCDDVMDTAWSFLWNITDETPANCSRFLKAEGLTLFYRCYIKFPGQMELVRNMMGLIGNIAEVFDLRDQLMIDDYLKIFCTLLDNLSDGIEISYNSAGVLAHLVSDGDERWKTTKAKHSRSHVSDLIVRATELWDLNARRFINYRSFKPILGLLSQWHAVGSQQWAIWALANLTTTDRAKYCRFVVEEGGVELVEQLVNSSNSTNAIRNLAQTVLNNIEEWKRSDIEDNLDKQETTAENTNDSS
ncbi:hypothetical protein niasHT_036775 [Heterodera trifolii]|uniref:Uncharacterized protein n=1 Tax=Heterodera trifolii TaxID=157864 RepID=A0ABD2IV06_9BILA